MRVWLQRVRNPRAALQALLVGAVNGFALAAAAQPGAAEPPQGTPAAIAPNSAAEPIDPELSQPLVPLDQFQLRAQQPTGPAPKPPAQIRYTWKIEGLGPTGLERRFRDASNLAHGRGRAQDLAQVRARAEQDSALLVRLLQAEGYYDASADTSFGQSAEGAPAAVTLTATPGQRYRLGEIVVTGPPTHPPGLARRALDLASGEPLASDKVAAAEANVSLQLPQQGYPFVKVGRRDIALDETTHRADYVLPVDPGPRSSFGRFVIAGEPVFAPDHVGEIARFKPGQLYDSRMVDDLRQALVATQLYGQLGVEPTPSDRPGPDGTTQADLRIQGTRGRSHVLSASAGYDTGLGASVAASWSALDLWPPEGALTLNATGGTQQQQFGVAFVRSNFGRRDRSLTADVQVSREKIDAYEAETGQVSVGVSRQSTPLWQKRWTYSAALQAIATSEAAFDVFVGAKVRRSYRIVAIPLELGYDRSDNLLNPTRGFRLKGRLSPEISSRSGGAKTVKYLKALAETDAYFPVGRALVLAGRLQMGSILGADWFDLAPTRRFYAGGGSSVGSVRGFLYQSLGPKDPSHNALGGTAMTDVSVEARYRFGNFGVVGFLDGGQVYQTRTPQFSDLRYGVGVGGRYYTSLGPLRIDVATPLSRRRGEGLIGVYVAIGQAF